MLKFGKDAMELHDIVAVWCAAQNDLPLPLTSATPYVLGEGWNAVPRLFQIERTGELTRGMLVVDRRGETTIYEPGKNRSEAQAFFERAVEDGPAPVQVEKLEDIEGPPKGVLCVTETPGPESLVQSLLSRVWGIE